jgi:serine/threonine protein kinase
MATSDRLSAALSERYRIERELGAGGMATVYLAEDLKHDRKVAIKVLKPELAAVVREDAPAAVRAEAVQRLRDLVALQAEMTGQPVAVVPILISRGGISRSRVMQDLQGLPVRYADTGILPHRAIAEWVARRVSGRH